MTSPTPTPLELEMTERYNEILAALANLETRHPRLAAKIRRELADILRSIREKYEEDK